MPPGRGAETLRAQAPGGNGRRRGWLIAGGLAVVLVGFVGGFVVFTGGEPETGEQTETGEPTEIPETAPGDEQAGPGYTVDQLEAALPTDDQLRPHFPEIERCRGDDEVDDCSADVAVFTRASDGEFGTVYLRFEIYNLDSEEVARRLDDYESDPTYPVLENPVGQPCSPQILIGHRNALIDINLPASGSIGDDICTQPRQLMLQYADQVVDALS
jgi:hypothetical protein